MIIIGENMTITARKIREAIREKDPGPIRDIALAQHEAGVDLIDINIGPAKGGADLMAWLVETVQEVSDLPLCLDTTNMAAMEAGLRAARGKVLINSISAMPERTKALMPLAIKYSAGFIGPTFGTEGMPHDEHERGLLAAELVAEAATHGISEPDIWIDPIVLPIRSEPVQVQGCLEFVKMLSDLAPRGKSACGLSNISKGVPRRLRGILNRTFLIMLERCGLYSTIANAFDKDLVAIAKGKMPWLRSVVHRVMDGEDVEPSGLCGEELDYAKTTKVLLGQVVYSDSWLQA